MSTLFFLKFQLVSLPFITQTLGTLVYRKIIFVEFTLSLFLSLLGPDTAVDHDKNIFSPGVHRKISTNAKEKERNREREREREETRREWMVTRGGPVESR